MRPLDLRSDIPLPVQAQVQIADALSKIASAIRDVDGAINELGQPDEEDDHSLVDALESIALSIQNLGLANAATPMRAVEAHSVMVKEGAESISSAISEGLNSIAEALDGSLTPDTETPPPEEEERKQ